MLPGGCAVMAAEEVEEVEDVEWRLPVFPRLFGSAALKFGPLIVSIDTEGNNMFTQVKENFNKAKEEQAAAVKTQGSLYEISRKAFCKKRSIRPLSVYKP